MVALVNQAPTKVSVVELTASLLSFIKFIFERFQGFPDSSVGKEYTCSAGNPGLIPGSGRSAGEGIGYSVLYSWAFLVKNLPAMQESWVRSLGWKGRLEKETATHSSILAWRIPWTA